MSLIPSTGAVILLIIAFMFFAGCTTEPALQSQTVNQSPSPDSSQMDKSLFFYGAKIPQADSIHPDYIRMNSDIFAQGETIEFFVVNEGSSPLTCDYLPVYNLYIQTGTWESLTRKSEYSLPGYYHLPAGNSTDVQRLGTSDLVTGHYKIARCGVSREFEVHAAPVSTVSPV